MSDFAGLSIDGRIAVPNDSDWDEARAAWNLVAALPRLGGGLAPG